MFPILKSLLSKGIVTENKSQKDESFLLDNFQNFIKINEKLCQTCLKPVCAEACPTGALQCGENKKIEASYLRCIECYNCSDKCPHKAISFAEYGAGSSVINMLQEKLETDISKNFGGSFHIRQLDGGSCNGCDHEMVSACNPYFDISRFGIDFVASPRHADCLLITGPVTWNLKEAVLRTIEATPQPRVIAAMGVCAISGAPFSKNYSNFGGVDKVVPVDIYIPGCPPHPYALLSGLLNIMKKAAARK